MTIDDVEAFGNIMVLVNETYGDPNRVVSDVKLRFYFHVLRDLTIEEIETAVLCMARTKTCHTFPTPGEIREAAEGKAEERGAAAFDDLIAAIHRFGVYHVPEFEDEALASTVRAFGGWETVCGWKREDRFRKRREFLGLYRAYGAAEGRGARKVLGPGSSPCAPEARLGPICGPH